MLMDKLSCYKVKNKSNHPPPSTKRIIHQSFKIITFSMYSKFWVLIYWCSLSLNRKKQYFLIFYTFISAFHTGSAFTHPIITHVVCHPSLTIKPVIQRPGKRTFFSRYHKPVLSAKFSLLITTIYSVCILRVMQEKSGV